METNAPPKQSLHHLQQWHVALADRLEKPVFFVKRFVLRMVYEWEVRVKDEGEAAPHRVIPNAAKRSRGILERCLEGFIAGSLGPSQTGMFARDD
ncbi:MAG: hypothetical protein DME42_08390 [Verrucomicrobia bacterium]|nr:MAG: hypothetical protein DME42_08390 [Verrucomicrobiota bacterium]